MIKVKRVSNHVAHDRMDRVLLIAQKIGWGEIVLAMPDHDRTDCFIHLTSTGILLVKGKDDTLITAYPASISLVKVMYGYHGYARIPDYLYNRVIKNQKIMG